MKVFLGGTCNESKWRDLIIPQLMVDFFNPVVDDWTSDCMEEEIRQREVCDVVLYAITPKMTGTYSIAEVVDDSNKHPQKTVLVCLREDGYRHFDERQWKSLMSVARMVKHNGSAVFFDLKEAAMDINARIEEWIHPTKPWPVLEVGLLKPADPYEQGVVKDALCPDLSGTWQQHVKQAVEGLAEWRVRGGEHET